MFTLVFHSVYFKGEHSITRAGNGADAVDQCVQGTWWFLCAFSGRKPSSQLSRIESVLCKWNLLTSASKCERINKAEAS